MSIYNESGILKKNGRGFHNPGEFATQNLYYVLWSNRYLCDENYSVSRDYFDSFSLIYVLEGKMGFLYDDRQIIVEHGEAILLDFRSKHYYRSLSEKLDKWEMLFKGSASEAYYRLLSECGKNVFRVKGQTQNVLEKIMGELDKQVPEEHTVSALIHTMLACVAEGRTNGLSDPVQKALAYMDSHLEQPLQIHEVAENIGLSRSYFSRLFRSETGQSPYDYILNVRIATAKDLLAGTTLSVSKVAKSCGFVNTSHFVRLFREHTGQTPAAFRNYFNINLKKERDIMIEEVEKLGKRSSTDE